ncbi:Topless-related protein 2 [Citrus sinensis]|uniref:Topless-related protein 2 n=1 Tax=Citrus sinensis TaxID=2711 RepID=A0ACB8I944_CITSI|nr:Topless-related protein 2 [Citrus sinensis]
MSSLSRELVFLILQFLDEEKFKESVHRLEQESGFFFNMKYFEEKALAGEWDEIEKYLSGFTKVDDNRYSMKIFFEIRKQKYLEALDRHDRAKAVEILVKDLKVFSTFNEELFKEITQLLTLENFRENEQLSKYGDTRSARTIMLVELKKLIEANPLFRDKLVFPSLKTSRLRTLINQSLNWQHQLCKNPRPNPDIKTLFVDHSCSPPNGARAPTPVTLPVAAVAKPATYAPLGAHAVPFPPAVAAANANALAGWMMNANPSSSIQSSVVAASSLPVQPNQVSVLKHPRAPSNTLGMIDYPSSDHEQLKKRLRASQSVDEATYPVPSQQATWSLDDLPRAVACTMHQGSSVVSMDFHPFHHTLLVVGCGDGEITLWDVGLRERLVSKPFKIWDMSNCSMMLQAAIVKDSSISVSRVAWSPDGNFIAIMGIVMQREMKEFIFSTAVDGKIKAWLYDNVGSRVDYDAPGLWCTTMLYSADGSRLFSCGTSKEGDSYLVEWNESEGALKRTYIGFRKKSAGVVQFDTTRNRILAAGEDNQIKFWDMDNVNMLTSTEAEGGLPSLPRLRFNKEGNLLVVTTADQGIKILANADGLRALRAIETRAYETSRASTEMKVPGSAVVTTITPVLSKAERVDRSSPARPSTILNGADSAARGIEKPRNLEDISDKTKPWELTEIVDPLQCRVVAMPESTDSASKVARLLYTNSGIGILALWSNGVQKLWKWNRTEQNPSGKQSFVAEISSLFVGSKATAAVAPQHWQPSNGLLMTNDVPENAEDVVPCVALSKNDSYVMSACGGKVSLFNMMNFKVMTTFMSPPPASTFLAFHPQDNNIIAIGMEDSTIQIYNVRVDEVKTKLKGHQKHITGLAFSTNLNILVSSGSDAQLIFWNTDTWEKRKSIAIQLPAGKLPVGETRVQFHSDQVRLLVNHETQLAIYDGSKMECIRQWVPQDVLSSPISSAAYSCNSQLIYATFTDGSIGVFDADSLRLRCRIAPSAYMSQASPNSSQTVFPLVVTSHPQEPNQLAVGLTDGSVKVIEPSETERKWGVAVPVDNGTDNCRTVTSSATNNPTPEQFQR